MVKLTKLLCFLVLCLFGIASANAKVEKVHATFESPTNTNTTWTPDASEVTKGTFTWSTTYYNQLRNIGLPTGDITKYKKLVVDTEIKSGEQFRILIYKGGSNLTLYASNGVNEFILADTLKVLYPDTYNEFLLDCTEICLSGNNNAAPGEAIIKDVYLETYNDEGEKVFATFESPTNTNTTWTPDASGETAGTFTWSTTYYNQLRNIGLPSGDISMYKKLVVDTEIKSGNQFRILIYKGGSNLTLYASNGLNEFILADTLKVLYPDTYNEFLLDCTEICLSGNNNAAPGEAIIKSVYLETYPENEQVDIPDIVYEEDPGKPAGNFVDFTEAFPELQPRIGLGTDGHPIVLGNGEVVVGQRSQTVIADLSAYSKLTLVTSPNLKLVLYMNHEVAAQQNAGDYAAEDAGKYVFMDVQADENGLIEVDLTQFDKQDLNCICLPWDNNNKGTVWYILLTAQGEIPVTEPDYYLVGSMNSWEITEGYKLEANAAAEGEYMITLDFEAGAEFKIKSGDTWYPGDGIGNCTINDAGNYTVYFRPDYSGGDDWFYKVIYVVSNAASTGEDAALKEAPEGWTQAITNGNLAGDDVSIYFAKEYPSVDTKSATIVAGAGKDNSRGIVVKAGDDTANESYAAWDSQFWIVLKEALPKGTKVHVEFDCKASQAAKATTQSHGAQCNYIHWGCMGDVNFTTDWQTFSTEFTVADEADNMQSIAFNLQEEKSATDYYFDNFGVWYQIPKEITDWADIIDNGDMEGEDSECFYVTEQGVGGPFLAKFTEGIGVDGSKAVKVQSADDPANDWDTQFFIRLPYQLPAGTNYRVSFDYKADKAGDFDTQSHAEPGQYIHWVAVGSGSFTTEWQTYSAEGTIPAECDGSQGEGFLKIFQTIAFNLAKNKVATEFIFDNVKFEVDADIVAELTKNPAVTPTPIESMAIVGDFTGGWPTQDETGAWDFSMAKPMTKSEENTDIWTLTVPFVAEAKTYEYKAAANGKYGDYDLPAEGNQNFVFGTDEYPAGEYNLTFTADTKNNTLALDVEKASIQTFTATFTTNAYWWDNVYAYAWSGDGENATKYLGDWPGTQITANAQGVYNVAIKGEVAPEKIIFNNGNTGEGNQTEDLAFEDGKAYEYVFTPTFDFENNNGEWAEGATFENGVTMDDITLTGNEKVKFTNNVLKFSGKNTSNITLAAANGKVIKTIEFKAPYATMDNIQLTASEGEVTQTLVVTDNAQENPTILYAIWTWTGEASEVTFTSTARSLNIGFINVTAEEIPATDITITPESGADIAAVLEQAEANVVKVGNIKIELAKDGNYTIGSTIEVPASLTFWGNDATVDASQLAGPMIAMANVEAPEGWTETNVEIAGVKVKGLKQSLFYSTCKNYLIKDFNVNWCNVELAGDVTAFDFTKGSAAENFNVTNSTFYAPTATTKSFYSSQSGQKLTEANGDLVQTFKFQNNTLYNLAKSKNFFSHRQSNQTWLTYDVQNNIFVNCGKKGQTIKGMNGGQSGKNPTWIIKGNAFNFDGEDTSADEATGDDDEPVQDCVAGVAKFADADNGDFNGVFEIDVEATAPESLGAPMWTLNFIKVITYTATFTTNAGWEKAYAYAWSGKEGEEGFKKFLGDWPGTEMTPGNGGNDWMISFKAENAPEKIIFNNGEKAQTADLDFEDGKAYEFTINTEWAEAIAAAQALAEDDGVAVGKLLAAIGVAQGITEPTDEQKAALQTAVDQYKEDNLDQEKDETAKVATNGWKKFDGSNAGVCATQFAPAITTYDGRTAQLAEVFEGNGDRTGTIIYQDITGLTNGQYKVGFYGNAFSTSGRDGFNCTMEDGATDVAYVFANEKQSFIAAHIATATEQNEFNSFDVEVTDGTIKLGMGKAEGKTASTNWHTMQIYQLTWFTTAKEVFAQDQEELKAVIAEAKALLADETKTEGKDVLEFFVYAAEQAVDSKMINISELEAVIGNLKDLIAGFKKANWYIDFAAGEYYVIDAESGLKMAAGHDWGTRGIVNEAGLDLTLTPYTESRTVTFDSRVYNSDVQHYLGSNLYMDSNEWGWALEYQGFGFYILNPNNGKYINIDLYDNLVESDTPREWILVSKAGVRAELIDEMSEATKDDPVDATGLIVAQNFNRNDSRNAEAWSVSEDCTNKNLSGGNNVNNCAESFHSTFTIMQTISDCPAGFYQMTAQGFYRQDEYGGDEAPAAPMFFANEINGDVPALAEGGPNGMSSASEAFTNGDYTIEPITFEVKEDGMMYIGITQPATDTQWVIWDNFQLKYFGQENPTTGITSVNAAAEQNAAGIYNLNGQKVEKAQKGLYIINGKKQVIR